MAAGEQPTLFSSVASPVGAPEAAVRLVAVGAPAREALWHAIADAQRDDPLAAVTVVVPSNYAGLSLRRALGRRGGFLNVHFAVLSHLAELFGAPALAPSGRRPLAGPLRAEAVHAALLTDPGPFATVADHPSTAARLASTFRDLRRARLEPDALTPLRSRGDRAATVARLYADFRAGTTDFYDEADLLDAATAAVRAGTAAAGDAAGTVVVYLPTDLSAAEVELVRALVERSTAVVLLGVTGDDEADAVNVELVAALGSASPPMATSVPAATAVLSAADPEDEVRAVVRRIAAAADAGTPLHELAILYRLEEPYARLVPEMLASAGVDWNGPSPRRLAECVAARVLLGVVHLAGDDFARDDVAAWLATGPVRDARGMQVPAARWDVVSREAGIVRGADQWADRLARHRGALEQRSLDAQADDAHPGWVTRLEGDLASLDALTEFVAELVERAAAPPEPSWSAHAAWAAQLLDRYLGGPEVRHGRWPAEELDAARRVDALLSGLAMLDQLGAPVDLARFRRALSSELDVPLGRVARFGSGVFVGPLTTAQATTFEQVFLLGAAEGTFPPRGREDPLLPDADRRVLGSLPLHADRRAAERRTYLSALAAAPARALCFPRADPRAQRKRLPARWLLESAAALDGEHLGAEAFLELGDRPWLTVVQSFEHGIGRDGTPASVSEHDLRALGEWRVAARPLHEHPLAVGAFGAGVEMLDARASDTLTRFDGGIGSGRGLTPDASHAISPTALQDWATCPFSYLLARVLRVREVPKPETTDTISALDEGTLVHTILEEFLLRARPRTSPAEPWDDADRELLLAITLEACADAERRGITGRALHWHLARRRVVRAAAQFLEVDARTRRDHGVVPSHEGLEVSFGDAATPVTLTLPDGRNVAFRGRIDRIDNAPDGSLTTVYDYKTGSPKDVDDDDPVEAGRRLQLPVYALAARARGATAAQAFYWYTRAPIDQALVPFPLDDDRFAEVVGGIVDGIDDGCFVAYPGETGYRPSVGDTFENCVYCPYDRLCSPDRLGSWDRKHTGPAVDAFVGLELEAEDDA
jgi:hypothetical protein